MKKLFKTIKAWLRSRVTALRSEEGKVKSEELKDTQYVYTDKSLVKVKGDRVKVKGIKNSHKQPTPITAETFPLRENKKGGQLTLPEVQSVLRSKYELRYNLLSEQSEYRERDSEDDFLPITKRVYMTWLMDIQAEGYNYTWLEGVRIAAESLHIPSYHPVTQYFTTLPQWDGTDRLHPLMQRLTTDAVMVGYLCRWMLALVAQAQGRTDSVYANSVAPLLVSEQQGLHKSTFCRMLLPPELREYYTDNFDLTAESQCERKLLDCLLINLDEFDRYSSRKQSTLKNLMQMTSLRMRKAYRNHSVTLPRIASFIGTSNTAALLTDPDDRCGHPHRLPATLCPMHATALRRRAPLVYPRRGEGHRAPQPRLPSPPSHGGTLLPPLPPAPRRRTPYPAQRCPYLRAPHPLRCPTDEERLRPNLRQGTPRPWCSAQRASRPKGICGNTNRVKSEE